ncbi:MAG TPA: alkaline phosphatase family protein [Anaeromyxobacteraceae bacterium]|nr:alkaline phosphatase family protein [Anaeromyxobacteraceae bacterium]
MASIPKAGRAQDQLSRFVRWAVRKLLIPVARRGALHPGPLEGGRRLLLVQLDGVSRQRLEWAIAKGHMPFLADRLSRGGQVLSSCRSGAPASTPAFQAGLFYGVSPSVPGFVWYDRATGREIRMDTAVDACRVETRFAERNPGLLRDGTSYFAIFSGAAKLSQFCLSGLPDFKLAPLSAGFNAWDHLATTLVHSITAAGVLARGVWETIAGIAEGIARIATLGRMKHEPRFFIHRLLVNAFMRELAVQGIVIDLARGIPIVYVDFVAYDEFAHRRGPESALAVSGLQSTDRAVAALFAAAEAVPEMRYDVYVFSDHGHVATEPFETLTGLSLPEYIALADGGVSVPRSLGGLAAHRLAQARGVRHVLRSLRGALPRIARRAARRQLDAFEKTLLGRELGQTHTGKVATAEAGDLAHVYFLDRDRPATLDDIRREHPGVLEALRETRAVGLVAVRGGDRGVALLHGDELDLSAPDDVARLPHPDPSLLADYLADLLALEESGDLVVQGWRGPGQKPVAYAWEFGSHGGVAPEEIDTFVIHPRGCAFRFDEVRRPAELYRFFADDYRQPAHERRRSVRRPLDAAHAKTPGSASTAGPQTSTEDREASPEGRHTSIEGRQTSPEGRQTSTEDRETG